MGAIGVCIYMCKCRKTPQDVEGACDEPNRRPAEVEFANPVFGFKKDLEGPDEPASHDEWLQPLPPKKDKKDKKDKKAKKNKKEKKGDGGEGNSAHVLDLDSYLPTLTSSREQAQNVGMAQNDDLDEDVPNHFVTI